MRTIGQIVKGIAVLAMIAFLSIKTAVRSSPLPFIEWMRRQPDPGPAAPPDFEQYEKLVNVRHDLIYPSGFRSNELDLYYPIDAKDKLPTILWIHGGSFVAGDKSGTAYWCTVMASHGFTVVSMNYEVAPEARYPAPIVQMGEAYRYLIAIAKDYPTLDPDRLIVGGDSAGAQIASQFLAIQTNPELASSAGIARSVPLDTLKAALLYCGPYNVKQLANVKGKISKMFLRQLGWAYLGERNWQTSENAHHASTVHHVTGQFPPTLVTDGNTGSFEAHGKELAEKLASAGVPVTTLFFPLDEGVVQHEYQFRMETKEAAVCLDATLTFLSDCLGGGKANAYRERRDA